MATCILIVDDYVVFRTGLRMLLETISDFSIAGEASNGVEALALVDELHPDVVILDWVMPGMNGLEALKRITEKQLGTKVIIMSMYTDKAYLSSAIQNHAFGYVAKDDVAIHLENAIRSAIAGEFYISPSLL